MGDAHIAKKLDLSLLSVDFADSSMGYHQWVGIGGISDHSPILLELKGPFRKSPAPFKFNSSWLKEEDYNLLVADLWRHALDVDGNLTHRFFLIT